MAKTKKNTGDQSNTFSYEIARLLGSNIVTLLGAYMMFASSSASNDNELYKAMTARLKAQEDSISALMGQVMALGVANVKLEARLAELNGELKKNVTRVSLYQAFLDSLPFPAWIKRRDENGVFRMVMINTAYAHKFKISKARYKDATDEEMWGKEIADGFKIADEKVFKSKGYLLTKELFPKSGGDSTPAWHSVWKFSIMLGEDKFGVGGLVVIGLVEDTHNGIKVRM